METLLFNYNGYLVEAIKSFIDSYFSKKFTLKYFAFSICMLDLQLRS